MINKSMIGLCVKFEAVKIYAPGAGKKIETYGIVTDYVGHGFWGVVYSFIDGEYTQSIIHSSKLSRCENAGEMHLAIASATGWAIKEQENITERMLFYLHKGDTLSVENLIKKNKTINFVLNIELGNNN